MKLIITGVPPWDGEYEFESFSDGTNREYHRIKEISGVRAGELIEALSAGDTGAWVAWSVVVLARHGKLVDPDDFWDVPENAIDWKPNKADDADPPTQPPSGKGTTSPAETSGGSSTSGGA